MDDLHLYKGTIKILKPIPIFKIDTIEEIEVEIINSSEVDWIIDDEKFPLKISYHWKDSSDVLLVWEGIRTKMAEEILPKMQSITTSITIATPSRAGIFFLIIDLVQENLAWLQEYGFIAPKFKVEIS